MKKIVCYFLVAFTVFVTGSILGLWVRASFVSTSNDGNNLREKLQTISTYLLQKSSDVDHYLTETVHWIAKIIDPYVNQFTSDDSVEYEAELKELKSRYNFASKNAGAFVLESNPGAERASAILDDSSDTYMTNPCELKDKRLVISLSEDILVDTILLLHLELYSSNVNRFKVYSSTKYPTNEWLLLDEFQVDPKRPRQFFKVKPTWARFLKLVMFTDEHESICTLSQIKVYGQTMLDSFKTDFQVVDKPQTETALEAKHAEPTPPKLPKASKPYENKSFWNLNPKFVFPLTLHDFELIGHCIYNPFDWFLKETMDDYALNDDDLLSALQNNSSAPENKAKKQEQFKKMIYSLGEHNRTQPKEKPKPAPKEKLENIISYLNINSTSTEHSDPYESIFKKLTRHVRKLETDNMILTNLLKQLTYEMENKSLEIHRLQDQVNTFLNATKVQKNQNNQIKRLESGQKELLKKLSTMEGQVALLHSRYLMICAALIGILIITILIFVFKDKISDLSDSHSTKGPNSSSGTAYEGSREQFLRVKSQDTNGILHLKSTIIDDKDHRIEGGIKPKRVAHTKMKSFTNLFEKKQ